MSKKLRAGRPLLSDKAHKREHLIKEARLELIKTGGINFSMNNVLKAAGGSKTTLYTYFGGREGLMTEVLGQIVDESFSGRPEPGTTHVHPRIFLSDMAEKTFKVVLSKEALALYRMAICEAMTAPDLAKGFVTKGPAIARKVLTEVLREYDQNEELKIPDPELAADFFFGMLLEGPLLYSMLNIKVKKDLKGRTKEAVERFLKAYS
ncbi:MAG: TetR/AcrR family transcriptional regulator [Bacteriovoracia bacterium]